MLHLAALLARSRQARGLRLTVPEATDVIADAIAEAARDGGTHAEAVAAGRCALGPGDVLPGVAEILDVVCVEAVFEEGTRLVSLADPVGHGTRASSPAQPIVEPAVTVTVVNEAPVEVGVSSHVHCVETNPRLRFDREAAYGMRLSVPAGATVTFPPGRPCEVGLTPIAGARVVIGFAGLVDGPLDAPGAKQAALAKARACGYIA